MVHLLKNVELTIGYLLEVTKDLQDDTPVYNSCFYPTATKEYLESRGTIDFEPILGLYDQKYNFIADYNFEDRRIFVTIKDFRDISKDKMELRIERDVEDNYRFENYDSVVYYEGAVVLC